MLHIIFTILKILGIIVLVLLALIVLLVLCILFVPIRYSGNIDYHEKLIIDGKITYLFHLISFRYKKGYGDIDGSSIKILGIDFSKLKQKRASRKQKRKKQEADTEMFEELANEINDVSQDKTSEKTPLLEEDISICSSDNNFINKGDTKKDISLTNKEKKHSKIHELFKKIKSLAFNLKKKLFYTITHFFDTIRKIKKGIKDFREKIKWTIEFIKDECTKEAITFIKGQAFRLLKHIRPRKIKGYIHFGFEDPSYTGQTLGILSIFYGRFQKRFYKKFKICPDFENKIIEGKAYISGRVQVYVLLLIAFKLYKNKNLKIVMERRRTYGRE